MAAKKHKKRKKSINFFIGTLRGVKTLFVYFAPFCG
jgi:hypothetical protein